MRNQHGKARVPILFAVVFLLVALAGGAYFAASLYVERNAKAKCANDMVLIGMAMHMYEQEHMRLPSAAICDKNGKPLLSWRVAILPYIEEQALFSQFKLDESWDSPTNIKLLDRMPKIFGHPRGNQPNTTHYRLFVGPGALFPSVSSKVTLNGFKDSQSETLLFVEAADSVPWTKPEELDFDPNKPRPQLGGSFKGGFFVIYCAGSPRFLSKQVPDSMLNALITPNGGESIPVEYHAPDKFKTGDY